MAAFAAPSPEARGASSRREIQDRIRPVPGLLSLDGDFDKCEPEILTLDELPEVARRLARATVGAAELLGWQDKLGSVAAGKLADIVAVAGDPLADVAVRESVGFVMKRGVVVKNELER